MEVRPIAQRRVARWSLKLAVVGALALACVGFIEHDAWSAPPRSTRAPPSSTRAAAPRVAAKGTYVVRAGDGWFQIAKMHNVTMQKVLAANHATTATKLRVGQVVHVPPSSAQPSGARAKPAARAPAPAK
jgi:LysM repeat protein